MSTPSLRERFFRSPYSVAIPPWLACYVLTLTALAIVIGTGRYHEGIFIYDATWYRDLATFGYKGMSEDGIRFFPLLPLLGRWLAPVLGGVQPALTVISGAAALVYLAQLVALFREEFPDATTTGGDVRAAWYAALAPGAFVLALAYTEPLSGALAVGFFRALRRHRPSGRAGLVAMLLGVLSGLLRPTGVLLALPAALEMARTLPRSAQELSGRDVAGRVGVVLSPFVGTGIFLTWSWIAYGEALRPYTMQTRGGLRGGTAVNPLEHLFVSSDFGLLWPLQVALLAVALGLLWVVATRMPVSYTAWAAVTLAASITSERGHSFPRYVAGVFPLAMALALITNRWWRFGLALLVCAAFGLHIALQAFEISYVP